ncbi:MAG TPA: hypothetical protein VIU46_03450 [Gallionellaceae bacterium]
MSQKLHRRLVKSAGMFTLALFASLTLLSACGGGKGGTAVLPGTAAPSVPTQSGSVSANFAATATTPRFLLTGATGTTVYGSGASSVQVAGAMTTLGSYTLTGSPAVTQDISGDANYAMGRWVWGTVTNTATATVLDTMNGTKPYEAWHYIQFNTLAALPTAGVKICDTGTFTQPTFVAGATGVNSGTTTGSGATLSFSATGAAISVTLSTTAGGATNVATLSATNLLLNNLAFSGGVGWGLTGGQIGLSDGGGGAIRINGIYNTTLNNGATYIGVFSFKCI